MSSSSFHLKYKVLQKIGEGSFSDVVKCEEIATGKYYAAKRLRKVYRCEKEMKSCAEIMAMQKLRWHPNIIRMIEYFYDHLTGRVTFILELMDISLYDFIKKKKRCVSETKAKYILFQVLKGLEHLHKSGLFHRDVKPENVLMRLPTFRSSKEIIKLADLGSIRGIYSKPPYTEYISTRWYRPPECLLTVGHYGPKMDVWATGCVFYEVLTLKPLFAGTDEIDQLARIHAILGTPPTSLIHKLKSKSRNCDNFPKQQGAGLESVAKTLSENGLAVLKLMLQYDPDRRISARRLVENIYFKDLRDQDIAKRYSMLPAAQEFPYHQNKGDYDTTPNLQNFAGKDTLKTKLPSTLCHIEKSKTSVDMLEYEIPLKPKANNLSGGTRPVVRNSEIRGWGINPYILTPKDKAIESSTTHFAKVKKSLKKRENDKGFVYSKTTSDLPQKPMKIGEQQQLNSHRLQSKSFVVTHKRDVNPKIPK